MLRCILLIIMLLVVQISCVFNPDVYLTTPQIVRRNGYPSETHVIETVDGYLLTLHRIPGSKNGTRGRQPVFLQHGILTSSADWVLAGNRSLGFILADAGYDVWMGNARGNQYSKAHISISPDDEEFWNFSWHEMGLYDIPAALYHIVNTTDSCGDIIYIGHSMGTTMFYVFASTFPHYAKATISLMVSLAPTAYTTHLKSPIRYLTPFTKTFQFIFKHLGINAFHPSNTVIKFLAARCKSKYPRMICENIVFVFSGYDREQMDEHLLPIILSHVPCGTSTKTIVHYSQLISNFGDFKKFDYGKRENLERYGQATPPDYDIAQIILPVHLIYSKNDWIAAPEDVKRLAEELPHLVGSYEVPFEKFNHFDFLWAKDVVGMVYEPMMKVLHDCG